MAKFKIPLLIFFHLFILQECNAKRAHCRKEFLDKVNVADKGYCWKFTPNRMKTELAEKVCNKIGGHLITVNTKAKGRLLAKFLKDSYLLTMTGYFGKGIGKYYAHLYKLRGFNGMPWTIIAPIRTTPNGRRTEWLPTREIVQWHAFGGRSYRKHRRITQCSMFSPRAKLWMFMLNCDIGYKSVCEQNFKPALPSRRPKPLVRKPKPRTKPTTTSTTTTTTTTPKPTTTTTTSTTTTTTTTAAPAQPIKSDDYDEYYYYYYD